MESTISFETKKELSPSQQHQLLQFKGMLIQRGYTDIIHISDKDEDSHRHYFALSPEDREGVLAAIQGYLREHCMDWGLHLER